MSWGLWLAGSALLGVAGLAVWTAFRNPSFVAGLTKIAVQAALGAILPVVSRRMPAEDEAAWRAAERRGQGDLWLRDRMRGKPGRDR